MERIGMVILGDTYQQKGFILEAGGGDKIYQFDPQTVNGLDPQARDYPARLNDKIVQFALDKQGAVTTVSTLEFRKSIHGTCIGVITEDAKRCACGNTTSSANKHCDVCAIRNNRCVRCGEPLP